jgi:hypothetical protein
VTATKLALSLGILNLITIKLCIFTISQALQQDIYGIVHSVEKNKRIMKSPLQQFNGKNNAFQTNFIFKNYWHI